MGAESKIEWCDHTFNPWVGCTKVSEACKHCYAESWATRSGLVEWGPSAPRRRTSLATWRQPRKWNAEAAAAGVRKSVFCASLADVFDDHPSIETRWRDDLADLIYETPHLDWLLLTKRPENLRTAGDIDLLAGFESHLVGTVRIGVTAENQERGGERIPLLRQQWNGPTFVSLEPLLGPIDMVRWLPLCRVTTCSPDGPPSIDIVPSAKEGPYLDWVIVGGESGPGARPMHPQWARDIRDQCVAAGVPFFFKQWGEWLPDFEEPPAFIEDDAEQSRFRTCVWNDETQRFDQTSGIWFDNETYLIADDYWQPEQPLRRVGKKRAGRRLDGREWNEVPR